ncbi:helix-turn-helix domain-containing protein [Nocardia sp. CA-128927]|uniref:helix-turn-helix domain-containing protein n=1 Tax=Nocardia sp. CA-128927 TaxID=3239975 RepID=UPI003D9687AB
MRSLLISGEPGTGRTTAVRRRLGTEAADWHDATDTLTVGERPWLAALDRSLDAKTVVVIEDMHLLPAAVARRVSGALDASHARFVLTSGLVSEIHGEHRNLVALCDESVELGPLRSRSSEIPGIVQSMLTEYGAAAELRFTPGVLATLARYSWPGNLGELSRVVRQLIAERKVGDVTTTDLQARYRIPVVRRSLTPLEQAECDAIVEALRTSKGNKRLAAERLGISRTTLYRSISRYGIALPDSGGTD